MEPAAVVVTVVGAVLLALAVVGARHPVIHPAEVRVFQAINGLPDALYWPLWLPMQMGNLVVGTVVGMAIAFAVGSWKVAAGVLAAAAGKLVIEKVIRKQMAGYLSIRQRPGTSQPQAVLRGADVPAKGMSFPSGHVILVAAVSAVLAPVVDPILAGIPFAVALLVALGRVFVGAHNPLDVTAGLGAGLLLGGGISLLV